MRVRVGVCAVELAAQLEGKATELAEALSTAKATEDRSKETLNEMTVRIFTKTGFMDNRIFTKTGSGHAQESTYENGRPLVARRWRPPQ